MVSLDPQVVRQIIERVIEGGRSHRYVIEEDINRRFFQWTSEFMRRMVEAKQDGADLDWYASEMFRTEADSKDLAAAGGLSLKAIGNIEGSQSKPVVLEASQRNYERLLGILGELEGTGDYAFELSVRVNDREMQFTFSESMVIVNTLAMKRNQIRGGSWSSIGKQVETPLMKTLCNLFNVDPFNWREPGIYEGQRQIDFMLLRSGQQLRTEVKLSGSGNPESFESAISRDCRLLVSDHLSETGRESLGKNNVEWVALADHEGYRKFGEVLTRLNIDHSEPRPLSELGDVLDGVFQQPDVGLSEFQDLLKSGGLIHPPRKLRGPGGRRRPEIRRRQIDS